MGQDNRILSGSRGGGEDAVVVRFPPGQALVQTVDFLTPVVDDPFRFGQIAAANALGLDFVPLARERYDLAFLPELFDWKTGVVLDLIRSDAFKARIAALGGYETTLTGRIMEPGMGLG